MEGMCVCGGGGGVACDVFRWIVAMAFSKMIHLCYFI